ncbi:MAG TPA: sigma-54 dependent transcriptional regulator [Terriglobales bacterium]|nr:sigma-54 dependent transcriptional regulator [Terriglobales bacterium]
MQPLRVMVVDDEPNTCSFLQAVFSAEGHVCQTFLRPSDAEHYLAENGVDLAMVDVYLGSTNGIDLVQRLRELQPAMYPVVMTAHVSVETAARSLTEGAVDYVGKPLTVDQIRDIATRADAYRRQSRAQADIPAAPVDGSTIVGRSPRMLEVYKAIGRVATSNANVLITGPSGTGKELVARAIHQHSKRAQKPFTPVNCGSFTETILESELFGHEKGAFTGADAVHKGLVEASDGGTLFLDEITETALSFQVKLLRVIQEQQVRRVGSTKYIPVDIRVVAASNRDISELLKQGQFREDLYYRLAVVQISVPALEERREDIPLLINHFLQLFNGKNNLNVSIEAAAIQRLQQMSWPGNVRELENTINRLAIFAATGRITQADVDAEVQRTSEISGPVRQQAILPDRLVELERQHILRILKETGGNRSEAARKLGIERKTLYKKALRLGIDLQALDKK